MATLHELQTAFVKADDAGNTEDAQVFADSIREHPTFQNQSQKKLSKGFKALKGDERKAQIHKHTARSLGIKESDLDSERGMGGIGRVQFKAQPTMEEKLSYLEKSYGRENLNVANIGGKEEFLYRDEAETGGKWRRVDEEGVSLADFTSDIIPEVIPTLGSIVGGVAGFAGGGIPGSVAGAAVGGAVARGAQDVTTRALSGTEQDFGEMLPRLGKEAVVGAGFDVATLGAGKFIGKGFSKAVGKTDLAQKTMKSIDDLNTKFDADISTTPGVTKGADAIQREGKIGGETSGALTREQAANRDEVFKISEVVTGAKAPENPAEALRGAMVRTQDDVAKLKGESELLASDLKGAIQAKSRLRSESLQRQIDAEEAGIRAPRGFDPENTGTSMQNTIQSRLEKVTDVKTQKYQAARAAMDESGVDIDIGHVSGALDSALSKISSAVNVEGDVIAALGPRLGATVDKTLKGALADAEAAGVRLNYGQLHNVYTTFRDRVPFGKKTSDWSPEQIAANVVQKELKPLVEQLKSQAPKGARDLVDGADKFYKESALPFQGKTIWPLIDKDIGDVGFKLSGTEVIRKALSTPKAIRDTLSQAGGARVAMKKAMQDAYLDSLGSNLNFDKSIVRSLWGDEKVNSLNRLKNMVAAKKSNIDSISNDQIKELMGTLSGKDLKAAEKKFAAMVDAEDRTNRLISNKLIKKIANETASVPSNPREFSKELMGASSDDIAGFMARLGPEETASVRQGVTQRLFDKAGRLDATAQRSSMKTGEKALWKEGALRKELTGESRKKYEEALGADAVKDLIDLDSALVAYAKKGAPDKQQVRGVFSSGSGLLVVAAGLPTYAYHRTLNAAIGSKLLRPFLRNTAKNPDMLNKLLPYLLSSSAGLEAISRETKEDPDFSALVQQMATQ